jgi:hypothetical protein
VYVPCTLQLKNVIACCDRVIEVVDPVGFLERLEENVFNVGEKGELPGYWDVPPRVPTGYI